MRNGSGSGYPAIVIGRRHQPRLLLVRGPASEDGLWHATAAPHQGPALLSQVIERAENHETVGFLLVCPTASPGLPVMLRMLGFILLWAMPSLAHSNPRKRNRKIWGGGKGGHGQFFIKEDFSSTAKKVKTNNGITTRKTSRGDRRLNLAD